MLKIIEIIVIRHMSPLLWELPCMILRGLLSSIVSVSISSVRNIDPVIRRVFVRFRVFVVCPVAFSKMSSNSLYFSEGNAHLQLELAEHEVEHLSSKVERLEKTNDHLNKKFFLCLFRGIHSFLSGFKNWRQTPRNAARPQPDYVLESSNFRRRFRRISAEC